jgi:hypothetical protein
VLLSDVCTFLAATKYHQESSFAVTGPGLLSQFLSNFLAAIAGFQVP